MDYTVPPFLSKTYEMVDDPSSDEVVSWSVGNNSFVVLKVPEFQKHFLPKYFKHSNFASFVRQLNTYGFRKVHPDRFEFANEWFLRGQKHLLKTIVRKKNGNQPPQVQSSSVASCVEVGKFGLEEEVERLKCDKNVLMQELVRLRQQQQATDHHLQTVGQRVHSMEQRQQQMMSFLAKAMQSPGFLGQLVQQQNESNHRIAGGNKKRRFPRQDEENSVGDNISSSSNGQIIKLHPSVNEAAKAMLRQILKMNSSSRLEPLASNSGPLLLGNLSSSNAMENGSFSSRISELMLAEVLPSSGPSSFPIDPGFPSGHPSNAISSDVQTHLSIVVDRLEANNYAEMNAHNYGPEEFLPNFTEIPGNVSGSLSGIPITIPLGPEIGNSDCVDPMSSVHSMTMPGENDAFSTGRDMDILVDEMPKLPSIDDVFWEQILTGSPCNVDTDELNSTSRESSMMKEQQWQSWQENGWDKIQRMKDLTEQLELLTSAGTRG